MGDLFKLLFMEPEGATGGANPGENKGEGEQTSRQGDDEGDKGKDPGDGKEQPTLTQSQVNALVGSAKSDAQKKALKELGVANMDEAKEALKRARELEDAGKTEAEKLKSDMEKLTQDAAENESRAEKAEAELSAFKSGVSADLVERVVRLSSSYEGDTVADRIAAVLKDFPEFLSRKGTGPKDLGKETSDYGKSAADEIRAQVAKGMSL